MKNDFKSMNFVYYSKESYTVLVIGHIRYVWGDIDIRDYLPESVIQEAEDIVIATNGGTLRVLHHDKIPSSRKYQVVDEFTKAKDVKSKYILICPDRMQWELSEIVSEGILEAGDKYLEIVGDDINEMELLNLASNLSYMYGIRFVPHTIKEKSLYRITLDKDNNNVWKDVSEHIPDIKKFCKLSNICVDSCKKKKTKVNENLVKAKDFGWEW